MSKKTVVIVAGGRDFGNRRIPGQGQDFSWYTQCTTRMRRVLDKLAQQFENNGQKLVIRHGGAKGADTLAEEYGNVYGHLVEKYPANWDKYGKRAGVVRNQEMTKGATMLVAFWDGESHGTLNMIETAVKRGLEIHVYRYAKAPAP